MPQTIDEVCVGIAAKLNPVDATRMGFKPVPVLKQKEYVFIGVEDKGKGVWYRLVGDKDKPTTQYLDSEKEGCLVGRLVDAIVLVNESDKYGATIKCDFTFDIGTGMPVVIRSGGTVFAEGLIRSLIELESIPDELTIVPKLADESDKVIFCNLIANGERIIPKNSDRLITWKGQPRQEEVINTFLPSSQFGSSQARIRTTRWCCQSARSRWRRTKKYRRSQSPPTGGDEKDWISRLGC